MAPPRALDWFGTTAAPRPGSFETRVPTKFTVCVYYTTYSKATRMTNSGKASHQPGRPVISQAAPAVFLTVWLLAIPRHAPGKEEEGTSPEPRKRRGGGGLSHRWPLERARKRHSNTKRRGGMDMRGQDESRGSPLGKAYSTRPSEGGMNVCFPNRGSGFRIPFPAPN